MEKYAYFAGGCFWCITPTFAASGAIRVISGYSGGDEVNPSYEDVKHQKTGHRETIAVLYDDSTVSYRELLDIFLSNVDPFDGEGQYIDRGHSYTLAVYYQDSREQEEAGQAIRTLAESSGREVRIALEPFRSFYPAEEYHQDYYLKNPGAFAHELIASGRRKGHYCYMLRCADGTLYTGYTTDPARREKEHNSDSRGAKYTRSRRPVRLVYTEEFLSKEEAMQREYYIKHKLTREQKEKLVAEGR